MVIPEKTSKNKQANSSCFAERCVFFFNCQIPPCVYDFLITSMYADMAFPMKKEAVRDACRVLWQKQSCTQYNFVKCMQIFHDMY